MLEIRVIDSDYEGRKLSKLGNVKGDNYGRGCLFASSCSVQSSLLTECKIHSLVLIIMRLDFPSKISPKHGDHKNNPLSPPTATQKFYLSRNRFK
jgi:hypothetical protein